MKIGEPKILHSILSLFQIISISHFLFYVFEFGELGARKKHPHPHPHLFSASVDTSSMFFFKKIFLYLFDLYIK